MRKILISGFIVAVLSAGAIILTTIAQTTSTSTPAVTSAVKGLPAMVLEVNQHGKVLLRGTLVFVSSSSNSLTVKSWGGDWTISVSSSTEILPNGDITKFQTGDFVGVQGVVNKDALWSINATVVRDWNAVQAINTERKENKKEAEEIMKTSLPKNWQGIASNVNTSNNSLTLTVDNNIAYTVNLISGVKLYSGNWLTIMFSDVKNGDTVRVWGPSSSSTITASVLRDISLPVNIKKGQE